MRILLLSFGLFFCFWVSGQKIITGTAKNIYDGDTFTLVHAEGETRVRILGIDAPEIKQDFGIESRDYARGLLADKLLTVYLEPGETYGRSLGHIITEDGKHYSYEMVAKGYAWWYDQYSSDKFLEAAMNEAKAQKLGLWSKENAQAPWVWRRSNK